jgi:hypothetical protein
MSDFAESISTQSYPLAPNCAVQELLLRPVEPQVELRGGLRSYDGSEYDVEDICLHESAYAEGVDTRQSLWWTLRSSA